jgi:hypothetical protein
VGKHIDEVVAIMRQRRTQDAVLIQGMIEVRDRYNADVVVLSPDVSSVPAANRPGPNFFQEAVDGNARIANMMMPKVYCPVRDPDKQRQEALADRRQGALYGAWYDTQLQLKLGRSYRHLTAYGTHAMIVLNDDHRGRADIQIRDPLTAFPELRAQDDVRPPKDCGFLFARSAQWIQQHYPDKAPQYLKDSTGKGWDTLWDVVEWIDEDDIIIGVMGPRFPAYGYADARPYGYTAVELGRWPNKIGRCTAVVPRRATMDRIIGQLTAMINYSDLYARLLDLQIVATEKSIFPDLVVIGKTGLPPQLVGGKWFDGRTGNVNMVIDGAMEVIGKEPGPGTIPMLQLIDQHLRGGMGANALFGGNAGAMRTGAGVDALGDVSVNPLVAESQMIMERSLVEANALWMDAQKAYHGDETFTCVLGLAGSPKQVSYIPNRDFKDTANVVKYPMPGADINKLAVALTQLAATGVISTRTARDMHPLVPDPDEDDRRVGIEKMENATIAGFTNEIAQGQQSSAVAARATELVAGGMAVYLAIAQATAEAAQGPQGAGAPTGPDGQPMSPGLAALMASQGGGLTPKGAVTAQEPAGSPVPAASPNLMDLRHVLQGVNEQISPGAT